MSEYNSEVMDLQAFGEGEAPAASENAPLCERGVAHSAGGTRIQSIGDTNKERTPTAARRVEHAPTASQRVPSRDNVPSRDDVPPADLNSNPSVSAEGADSSLSQREPLNTPAPGGRGKPRPYDGDESRQEPVGRASPAPAAPVGRDDLGAPQAAADAPAPDKRAAFRALITGEYRDQYAEATQRLINRRFRETEGLRAAARRAAPLMDALSERYGIDPGEPEALAAAVRADVSELLPADPILAALSARYDIDAGDKPALLSALQKENAARPDPGAEAALAERHDRAAADFAAARCRDWLAEAEALRERCPDFDLAAMGRDRVFTALLAAGLPLAAAWRAADAPAAEKRAAARARRDLAAQIRAGYARPTEAGAASQAAFAVRSDPARLSDGQVRDVLAKLDRREHVSFG